MPVNPRIGQIRTLILSKPAKYGPIGMSSEDRAQPGWLNNAKMADAINAPDAANPNHDIETLDSAQVKSLITQPEYAAVAAILITGPQLQRWLDFILSQPVIYNTVHVRQGFVACFPGANNPTITRLQAVLLRKKSDAEVAGLGSVTEMEVNSARHEP